MNENAEITIDTPKDDSVMIFTLIGNVYIGGEKIREKTAVKLTGGDKLTIKNADNFSQVLFIQSKALNEPVAWAGPIVMNTNAELQQAFSEIRNGSFLKETIEY